MFCCAGALATNNALGGWRDRVAWLECDDAFLRSGLELSPARHKVEPGLHTPYDAKVFEGLHGVFDDSLPDGWGRLPLDRRARQIGPVALTPLDRLACVGETGMGALVYAPAVDSWGETGDAVNLDRLADGARRVLEGAVEDVISELGRAGGSPGGARPKALIAVDEEGRRRSGRRPGVLRSMAGEVRESRRSRGHRSGGAGLRAHGWIGGRGNASHSIAAGRRLYFSARRFDRDGPKRRHAHSASGLLYADFRLPSLDYSQLIALAQAVTRNSRDRHAAFTMAVFNVLAHNRDDHAQQFGFLMERDGTWRLAPACDLTFAHGPGGEHATSVLGRGKDIGRGHMQDLGATGPREMRRGDRSGRRSRTVKPENLQAIDFQRLPG